MPAELLLILMWMCVIAEVLAYIDDLMKPPNEQYRWGCAIVVGTFMFAAYFTFFVDANI